MATVIITGGTGLIGKRLSSLLLGKGYEVIV
ncbi:MAG: NAD-dependent epimerase/dehydratase family protein, partial [Nostoc sp.]